MYIKRYILGISLIYKTELKRMLIKYLVKTFIKGGRYCGRVQALIDRKSQYCKLKSVSK